ncbi:hypothetical protein IY145_01855 [Methylosinus sp. H3A]|uniref:hypothetical protein n=1 Tax=Methylosinus sp. H3A TaxID=2785786 RepID=UPI0018C29D07|nr:hypothetical protein [Methylosinus sp. H3A]MBG0808156.1 hypothetical protein [Methylosinus sp. H3A]
MAFRPIRAGFVGALLACVMPEQSAGADRMALEAKEVLALVVSEIEQQIGAKQRCRFDEAWGVEAVPDDLARTELGSILRSGPGTRSGRRTRPATIIHADGFGAICAPAEARTALQEQLVAATHGDGRFPIVRGRFSFPLFDPRFRKAIVTFSMSESFVAGADATRPRNEYSVLAVVLTKIGSTWRVTNTQRLWVT